MPLVILQVADRTGHDDLAYSSREHQSSIFIHLQSIDTVDLQFQQSGISTRVNDDVILHVSARRRIVAYIHTLIDITICYLTESMHIRSLL